MANMYDITGVSYQASRQKDWFVGAILGGKLVDGDYVTVLPSIKKSTYLNMLGVTSGVLKTDNGDCAWEPEEAVKLSEQLLEVNTYKVNLEDCVDRFENIYMADMLRAGANNDVDSLPSDFTNATLDLIGKQVNKEIETLFVGGDTTQGDAFDGVATILKNDAKSVKITGSTLTKANVLGEIEKVYAAIPEAVLGGEYKLSIWVSNNTYRALRMAIAEIDSHTVATSFTLEGGVIRYLDVEIVPVLGLGNDEMVAIARENAVLGTDLVSDFSEIEIGSFPKPQENKFFVKGRMRLGVAVAFPDEAVIYSA